MIRKLLVYVLLSSFLSPAEQTDIRLAFPGQPTTVDNFVAEIVAKSKLSGSLRLNGSCTAGDSIAVPLPHPPHGPFTGALNAFDALVAVRPNLIVKHDQDHYIELTDSQLNQDVLDIRIHQFSLHHAHDLNGAISELINSREVEKFLMSHHIRFGLSYNTLATSGPTVGPGASLTLDNMELHEALDKITETFPGFWVYEECGVGNTRRVTFRGVPVAQ